MRSTIKVGNYEQYQNAFIKTADQFYGADTNAGIIKKLIFYGVRMVNTKPNPTVMDREEAVRDFQFAEAIKIFMGTLTPSEFVNLFPIKKDFDGHKYECKDYFYTRNYLRTLPDEPIGDIEAVMNFLWEYHNWETRMFTVKASGYMDNLCRLEGQPTAWESFCDDNGIKTYIMHTDQNGKQFMVDRETGQRLKVKKRRPRYLRPVQAKK